MSNSSQVNRNILSKARLRISQLKAEALYHLRARMRSHGHCQPTKFVIIGTIRSGSTMLTRILNQHPAATCFYEPFHMDTASIAFNVVGFERMQRSARAIQLRSDDPITFINQYIFRNWHSDTIKAVGFKLLYTQARQDSWWKTGEFESWWDHCGFPPTYGSSTRDLWQYLSDDQSIKVIHIKRVNKIEAVLSAQTAINSGAWGDGASGGFKDSRDRKYISPETISLTIKENALFESDVYERFAQNRLLAITYEELKDQTEATLGRVCDFLEIPRQNLKANTRKMRTTSLRESIENHDEIKDLFPHFFD